MKLILKLSDMKRKANISLPKGKEAKNIQFKVEDGKIEVIYDLEDKFEPKDGDFLMGELTEAVIIYKSTNIDGGVVSYTGGTLVKNTHISLRTDCGWGYTESYRYATEEEKSAFLERLETELSKRWNPETKQLEDIRWKPKESESYFFVNSYGGISKTIRNTACDSFIIGIGNAFKTEEAAKPYADQIKEIFKNSKAE